MNNIRDHFAKRYFKMTDQVYKVLIHLGLKPYDDTTKDWNYVFINKNPSWDFEGSCDRHDNDFIAELIEYLRGKTVPCDEFHLELFKILGVKTYSPYTNSYSTIAICKNMFAYEGYSGSPSYNFQPESNNMILSNDVEVTKEDKNLCFGYDREKVTYTPDDLDKLQKWYEFNDVNFPKYCEPQLKYGCRTFSMEDIQAVLDFYVQKERLQFHELELGKKYIVYGSINEGKQVLKVSKFTNQYGLECELVYVQDGSNSSTIANCNAEKFTFEEVK